MATHNQGLGESQQAAVSAKQLETSELLNGMSLQNLAWSLGRRPAMSSPFTPSTPLPPEAAHLLFGRPP